MVTNVFTKELNKTSLKKFEGKKKECISRVGDGFIFSPGMMKPSKRNKFYVFVINLTCAQTLKYQSGVYNSQHYVFLQAATFNLCCFVSYFVISQNNFLCYLATFYSWVLPLTTVFLKQSVYVSDSPTIWALR